MASKYRLWFGQRRRSLLSSLPFWGALGLLLWPLGVGADETEQLSAVEVIRSVVEEDGVKAGVARWNSMKAKGTRFEEGELNVLGYTMIQWGETETAVEIFRLNTELFPESWNVWDSLGEGLIFAGRVEQASEPLYRSWSLLRPDAEPDWVRRKVEGKLFNYANETDVERRFEPGENTGLAGPYLGQKEPGVVPEIFAPGIVSIPRAQEFAITFSPDGRELYFNRDGRIRVSHWREEGWSAPDLAPFNTPELNHEAHITPDGRHLYFGSGRPRPDKEKGERSYGIWMMERLETGWSEPVFAFEGMYVTTTRGGRIYLTTLTGDGGVGVIDVEDGVFGKPRRLGAAVNEPELGRHPGIAPDESFLVFDSDRDSGHGAADLYVTFRQADGSWSQAINMGPSINTPSVDYCASISPDGRFLFYRSRNDIYWVSTEFVKELKKQLGG